MKNLSLMFFWRRGQQRNAQRRSRWRRRREQSWLSSTMTWGEGAMDWPSSNWVDLDKKNNQTWHWSRPTHAFAWPKRNQDREGRGTGPASSSEHDGNGVGPGDGAFCTLMERFAYWWKLCIFMENFAHWRNILHIYGTFCTLMEGFAHWWNVLHNDGTLCRCGTRRWRLLHNVGRTSATLVTMATGNSWTESITYWWQILHNYRR